MQINNPELYRVDKDYLRYLHKIDYRVSVKYNGRPYAGIITSIGEYEYLIPLTSQTTEKRTVEGKGKRNSFITTFITETSGLEISNLLYNNMIPISENLVIPLNIDPEADTYESNEIRYLRKNWKRVEQKALKVYLRRYDVTAHSFEFLRKTCCDFKRLEEALNQYRKI